MFSKLSIVIASVLITLAAAIPTGTPPPPINPPPPSSPQCCSSVVPSTSTAASAVAARLGLDLTGLDVLIGLSCSPITVLGNNCGSTTVTCDAPEQEWGGLIAINCIPVGGTPAPPVTPPNSPQCCSSVVPSNNTRALAISALLGIDLTGLDVPIGLSCSPITGVFPNNCASISLTCDAPRKELGTPLTTTSLPCYR
ncbi:hypothetical protein C8J57DRAFT_1330968 [Mycena rebaudengoi]|nr:hypothetical protein C8J57DRAFT_1330968 [Mycena rebaudengoi]